MLAVGNLARCGCSGLARGMIQSPVHLASARSVQRCRQLPHIRAYSNDGQQGYQPQQQSAGGPPFFTSFSVYKGKGAMSLKVIKPTIEPTGTGNGYKLARDGVLFLEFANASPSSAPNQYGNRSYNWSDKVTWGMGVLELCAVLSEPQKEHKFYHDPNKGGPNEGAVSKGLNISPAPSDGGYFFNVFENVKATNTKKQVSVSLTPAEFFAFRRIGEFVIPYLMGFDLALAAYTPQEAPAYIPGPGQVAYATPPMGGPGWSGGQMGGAPPPTGPYQG